MKESSSTREYLLNKYKVILLYKVLIKTDAFMETKFISKSYLNKIPKIIKDKMQWMKK